LRSCCDHNLQEAFRDPVQFGKLIVEIAAWPIDHGVAGWWVLPATKR
jgi:hypothetical protein